MNSEELEQSLRSEFENHLRSVLAAFRQETADFQGRIEAEFEKQKSQMNEEFRVFTSRFDSEVSFDPAFLGSVAEHLRLARDEGARVAASAMVEAENLGQSPLSAVETMPAAAAKHDAIRDAVDDISSKDSQSSILKSLVQHAENFAPRGAFFIIKSDHFAGWKVFGGDEAAERSVRDIHFPVATDSMLSSAIADRRSSDAAQSEDERFLSPLSFGDSPERIAVPLIARGRGVAVLYAEGSGDSDGKLDRDALETLVRVAGLTVELLAANQAAKPEHLAAQAADLDTASPAADEQPAYDAPPAYEPAAETFAQEQFASPEPEPQPEHSYSSEAFTQPEAQAEPQPEPSYSSEPFTQAEETPAVASPFVSEEGSFQPVETPDVVVNPFDAERSAYEPVETPAPVEQESPYQTFAEQPSEPATYEEPAIEASPFEPAPVDSPFERYEQPVDAFAPPAETFDSAPVAEADDRSGDMVFEEKPAFEETPVEASPFEEAPVQTSPFEQPREEYEPAVATTGGYVPQAETPVIEAPIATAPTSRLSERNVDLPIEVPEDERRIHNDARRFARLLVSEIKLYNEKKVTEGRDASDLYDRLREAIDRSREMYDKRVQPPVAAKFDYFHYELVNSLAEGNADKLGNAYPGSAV